MIIVPRSDSTSVLASLVTTRVSPQSRLTIVSTTFKKLFKTRIKYLEKHCYHVRPANCIAPILTIRQHLNYNKTVIMVQNSTNGQAD